MKLLCLPTLLLTLLIGTLQPALAVSPPPELMLASRYEAGVPVADYWVSEKLDGVRGYWDGRTLWTRGGHRVHPPAWFTAGWPAEPMDGELWIGRGRFDEVSGIVRAVSPVDSAWRRVRFMVFDLPAQPGRFHTRRLRIQTMLAASNVRWLQPVAQFQLADAQALAARLDAVIAAGGEGLMLHHRDALYQRGRSDHLLKYKRHDDAEAQVVGHIPGKGKYTGMLGSLLVQRADGTRFRLGSGLSDAQRAAPPPIGSHVTFRYNGLTANGLPRFARFVRVRHDLPPPDPR